MKENGRRDGLATTNVTLLLSLMLEFVCRVAASLARRRTDGQNGDAK